MWADIGLLGRMASGSLSSWVQLWVWGRVVLRWVIEARARETVRHWIVFHCVIKSLKNIPISAAYMTVVVPILQLAIIIPQHMCSSLQSIRTFSAVLKSIFLGSSVSQWKDFFLCCVCLEKKRWSTKGLRKLYKLNDYVVLWYIKIKVVCNIPWCKLS